MDTRIVGTTPLTDLAEYPNSFAVELHRSGRCRAAVAVAVSLFLLLLPGQPAVASQITVTGGFTAFTGRSGGADATFSSTAPFCDAFFQGIVAGQLVQTDGCENSIVHGPASLLFPSTLDFFEFQSKQLGSDDPTNALSFVPAPPQEVPDINAEFILGKLSFTNGVWFGSGKVNFFHLEIVATSPDFAFGAHTLSDDFVLDIRVDNSAGASPEANADCFSFSQFAAIGALCAYETGVPGKSNETTVTLWGKRGSLIPTQFTDPVGGFILPGTPQQAVAEPMSLVLLGTGLAAMVMRRRRKQ